MLTTPAAGPRSGEKEKIMEITGKVFKGGSAKCLARVVSHDHRPFRQAEIESVRYSVYLVGRCYGETVVPGHDGIYLSVRSVFFHALQTDSDWDVDQTGYNFKHALDVSKSKAFAKAGRTYRIVFEVLPKAEQIILVRFLVRAEVLPKAEQIILVRFLVRAI